jgi:hypothetical protein
MTRLEIELIAAARNYAAQANRHGTPALPAQGHPDLQEALTRLVVASSALPAGAATEPDTTRFEPLLAPGWYHRQVQECGPVWVSKPMDYFRKARPNERVTDQQKAQGLAVEAPLNGVLTLFVAMTQAESVEYLHGLYHTGLSRNR